MQHLSVVALVVGILELLPVGADKLGLDGGIWRHLDGALTPERR